MKALRLKLSESISQALRKLSFPKKDYSLTPPKNSEFGDLSSNIALFSAVFSGFYTNTGFSVKGSYIKDMIYIGDFYDYKYKFQN